MLCTENMSLITEIKFIDDPKGRSFLEGVDIQMHDHLTDDANWDDEFWDFESEYLNEYSKKLQRIFSQSANGIEFQALWVGDNPNKIIELSLREFIEIVKSNKIGTKTKYVVASTCGNHYVYAHKTMMKYFTSEWWFSGCKDESVFKEYQKYYSSISAQLPTDVRTLEKYHTLHDSNIKSIKSDFLGGEITINLSGWDQELNNPVNYELLFIGVTKFNQILPLEESGYGELGYWEYEVVKDGIEIRMLFASSAEIGITFNKFRFSSAQDKA